MEKEPTIDKILDYDKVLKIDDNEIKKDQLKKPGVITFVVTPEFNVIFSENFLVHSLVK